MAKIKKVISDKEIFAKIDESFEMTQDLYNENLKRYKSIHTIKNSLLKKEAKLRTEKLGIDHPTVIRMNARLNYNKGLLADLDSEIERTRIKVPAFDKNSWMVHGYVGDKDGNRIGGLTIGLYDDKGNALKQHGCSNRFGYYSITLVVNTSDEKENLGSKALFLGVSDKKGKVLHIESEPVIISVGNIVYRDICLPDEDERCTPPRAPRRIVREIRKTKKDAPGRRKKP